MRRIDLPTESYIKGIEALEKAMESPMTLSFDQIRRIGEQVYGEGVKLARVTPCVGKIAVVPYSLLAGTSENDEIYVLNPFNKEMIKVRRGSIRIDGGV